MVRACRVTITVLCLVGFLATAPTVSGDGDGCTPPDGAPVHWSDALQNDAGSGGDAGDLAAAALDLAREGTANGSLDYPAEESSLLDLSDWFTLRLGGAGELLMANVTVEYAEDVVPPFGDVQVEIYPPGAGEPVAWADSRERDTASVPDNRIAGLWRFHVQYLDLPMMDDCEEGSGLAVSILPQEATTLLGGYRVYVGCHPVCVEA